jgi:hypothetical protein
MALLWLKAGKIAFCSSDIAYGAWDLSMDCKLSYICSYSIIKSTEFFATQATKFDFKPFSDIIHELGYKGKWRRIRLRR